MAYCFQRGESVGKAVRRLGDERIEKALECLKIHDQAKAIHCARKEIKKLRAVLRLVRARIGKRSYGRASDLLRKAANHLAGPRDAYVKLNALKKLLRHLDSPFLPATLLRVQKILRDVCNEEMKHFEKNRTAKQVARTLCRAAKRVDRLGVDGRGWEALCQGVKAAYARGRQAYQTVLEDASAENFHTWRKRAKDLWYQMTLLQPIWPGPLESAARELEALSEHLGDDHDFAMLQQTIAVMGSDKQDGNEALLVKKLIEGRQRDLRAAARVLGARFYAEKPSIFCDRLGRHWEVWRAGAVHAAPPTAKAA